MHYLVYQQLNQKSKKLKSDRVAAANRVANATNQLEGANALFTQQPVKQQQAPWTRRTVPYDYSQDMSPIPVHDYSKDINYAPVTVVSTPSDRFPVQKTVSQTIAQSNAPRFVNNNTWTITNPVASYPNPNLVTLSTPSPRRKMSWYWWTY